MERPKKVLFDIETNAVSKPTKLWTICLLPLDKFVSDSDSKIISDIKTGSDSSIVSNIKNVSEDDVVVFTSKKGCPNEIKHQFLDYTRDVELWVGHNIIGYDLQVLDDFFGTRTMNLSLATSNVLDTLVLSRLFKYSPLPKEFNRGAYKDHPLYPDRSGGHSLEAWGKRLGNYKTDFHKFDSYSDELVRYCIQDVLVNFKILKRLLDELEFLGSI